MSLVALLKCSIIYVGLLVSAVGGEYTWHHVTSVSMDKPRGVFVYSAGPPQQPFPRPAPHTLDPNLLSDFSESFNLMQDVHPTGDNMFKDVSAQYVASIPMAFVEGEAGLVYDAAGRVYHLPHFFHNRTNPVLPLPRRTPVEAIQQCTRRYSRMATIVQRYGHMYYHFLVEALPRVVALQEAGALTPDTKLLTWGQPYEAAWLAALGVSKDQIVPFDPEAVYCADELFVPTPVPRITPPREPLLAVREALGVRTLPSEERNTIVYVSRAAEPTRSVANEAAVLRAISIAFPSNPVVVFNGNMAPAEAIRLFQSAKVVVGPHGAGLSHILFSAPDTVVVEFIFMADPPLMFWHVAGALGQEYWTLPVPQSYYMQKAMQVPEGEVVDILTAALKPASTTQEGACPPGTSGRPGGPCSKCPSGSYAYNAGSAACKMCTPGRVAPSNAATACSTCKPGTYSNMDATACAPCPQGTFSVLAGAGNVGQCLVPEERRRRLQEQALSVDMLTKLSPVFAKQMQRRALIQGAPQPVALTQQELCAAQAASSGLAGPYSAPYLVDGTLCPPTDGQVVAPTPPSFGVVDVPPIDIGLPTLPTEPVDPTMPPPQYPDGSEGTRGEPQPEQQPQPDTDTETDVVLGKKVLDTWAIALIATAAALVILPMLVCAGIWCVSRRRRTKQARAEAAAAAASGTVAGGSNGKSGYQVSNPVFNVKASSTSGSGGGSNRGNKQRA